jgi:hypothetical protein
MILIVLIVINFKQIIVLDASLHGSVSSLPLLHGYFALTTT